jgi:hypothetical protein
LSDFWACAGDMTAIRVNVRQASIRHARIRSRPQNLGGNLGGGRPANKHRRDRKRQRS